MDNGEAAAAAFMQYLTFYSQNRAISMLYVSAACWLFYDTLLNIDDEIKYIWKTRWSLPKVLYLVARYYGLIQAILSAIVLSTPNDWLPVKFCQSYYWILALGGSDVFTIIVNAIQLVRINALYGGNKKVLWFMCFCILAEFVVEAWASTEVTILVTRSIVKNPLPWNGCALTAQPKITFSLGSWIPCLVVAIIFFVLMVRRLAFEATYETNNDGAMTGRSFKVLRQRKFTPLLSIFLRDGTIYFFLIAATVFACMVAAVSSHSPLQGLPFPWLIAIYSKAGSALVLNLRKASSRGGPDTLQLQDMSQSTSGSQETRNKPTHLAFAPVASEYTFTTDSQDIDN